MTLKSCANDWCIDDVIYYVTAGNRPDGLAGGDSRLIRHCTGSGVNITTTVADVCAMEG